MVKSSLDIARRKCNIVNSVCEGKTIMLNMALKVPTYVSFIHITVYVKFLETILKTGILIY